MGEGTDRVEEAEGDGGTIEDIRKQLLEGAGTEADGELLEDFREALADREDVKGSGMEAAGGLGGESSDDKEEQSEAGKRQEKEGEGSGETPVKVDDPKQGEESEQVAGSGEAEKTGAGSNAQQEALLEEQTGADAYVFPAKERSTVGEGEGPQAQVEQEEPVQKAKPAQVEVESYARNDGQLLVAEQKPLLHNEARLGEAVGSHRFQDEDVPTEAQTPLPGLGEVVLGDGKNLREPMTGTVESGTNPPPTLHEPVDGVARYNPEGHQSMMTRQRRDAATERADDVCEVHRAEPDTVRRVVEHMGSPMLIVPGSKFHDNPREGVFAVRLTRESEQTREYVLYCTHSPEQPRTYLDLRHMGARVQDRVRIAGVEPLRPKSFAAEYNRSPPVGLENTRLIEAEGRLSLGTEHGKLEFNNFRLRAREGKAVIDGELAGVGQVKIAKSPSGFDFRLGDHSRVTGLSSDGGVILSYQRTTHDQYQHRRVISDFPRRPDSLYGVERLSTGNIEAVPEFEGNPRLFRLVVDGERRESVRELLGSTRTPDEYRKMKGDLAEEIARDLVSGLDLKLVTDHPFNEDPLKTRSERTGPDLLVARGDQVLAYIETKWWGNPKEAIERGEAQLRSDLRKHPVYHGRDVACGYVAILDWNPDSEETFLRLKEVVTGSESEVI